HLLAAEAEHAVVHPRSSELPARSPRLRDLVLVMREHEVEPSAMDLEYRAEVLLGHRGALDVPAGSPRAPRRVPARVLALLVRLPQRKVARVFLQRALLFLLGGVAHGFLVEPAGKRAVLGNA